jgi:magnesium-transporting ATPase (P-type)
VLPALALGAEPPEPDVMRRPPRSRRERLLSRGVLARVYLFLGLIEAAVAMSAFFFVLRHGGWVFGRAQAAEDPLYRRATTACLAAIVVMQVVNVFLCRSARGSTLSRGLLGNRLILAGLGAEALLLGIVYTPWGQAVFATAPLPAWVWVFTVVRRRDAADGGGPEMADPEAGGTAGRVPGPGCARPGASSGHRPWHGRPGGRAVLTGSSAVCLGSSAIGPHGS